MILWSSIQRSILSAKYQSVCYENSMLGPGDFWSIFFWEECYIVKFHLEKLNIYKVLLYLSLVLRCYYFTVLYYMENSAIHIQQII